jgi:trypsin
MKKIICDCLIWRLGTIRIEVGTSGLFNFAVYSCIRHNKGLNVIKCPTENMFFCDFLQVSKPFVISDKVKPIKLNKDRIQPGKYALVSGWGSTKEGGYSSWTLQKVVVPVVQQWRCKRLYKTEVITSNMFCAGTTGRDSCQGDSGGAIVYDNRQIGIVSWGEGCGRIFPGVYTNVAKFHRWIKLKSGV